jgi:hypothetical protein
VETVAVIAEDAAVVRAAEVADAAGVVVMVAEVVVVDTEAADTVAVAAAGTRFF